MGSEKRYFKILVTDSIDSSGIDILSGIGEVDVMTKLSESEIVEIIPHYDALMVRSGTTVTEKIINAGKKLKIIGRAGVGVDNVDVKVATDKGIFVVNSPQGNTVAAAEHTLALMMTLSRKITSADTSMRNCRWERHKFVGTQLQHKVLGIIGLGQVGGHVARVAGAMGMTLYCYDPYVNAQKAAAIGCTVVGLDVLLRESDYITLHIPLNESTRNLIRAETIATMRSSARVINVSRGGIVNEADLCNALASGKLAGAALDVFEDEKSLPSDSPLLTAPNLVMTPHLGASTNEAQVNVAVDVALQIKDTLMGSLPQSAVNIPGVRSTELQHILPLIRCCEILGKAASRVLNGAVEHISVSIEGPSYCAEKGELLLLAVANGVMASFVAHRVNFVNVRQILDDHSILTSLTKESFHSKNAVRVTVKNGDSVATLSGTTTEDGEVLLKTFKGIPMFMLIPEPTPANPVCVLYSLHSDTPGTLAKITEVFLLNQINIGNCHLGRHTICGRELALCVFQLDHAVSKNVIAQISNIESVSECAIMLD